VLATERHESHRIDRQLYGRSGRQGDPGSAQAFVSAEDELLNRFLPAPVRARLEATARRQQIAAERLANLSFRYAQFVAQRQAFRQRSQILKFDTWLAESLSFAGNSQTYARSSALKERRD